MCLAGRTHTESLSASAIYNGVTRPDLWIAVHALVADEQIFDADGLLVVDRSDSAKQLILGLIQDAASFYLDDEVKTRIMALKLGDSASTMAGNMLWARQRREPIRRAGRVESHLERAYLAFLEWLSVEPFSPKNIQIPFEHVVAYLMEVEGIDAVTARTNVYAYMRGVLDEATFKGSYT